MKISLIPPNTLSLFQQRSDVFHLVVKDRSVVSSWDSQRKSVDIQSADLTQDPCPG